MIAVLFALSLMLSACEPNDLLEFLEGPDAAPPAADADEPEPAEDPEPEPADEPDPADEPQPDDGAAGTAELSAIEQEIFETLNATRQDAGLDTLALTADIVTGARDYACTMADTGVFEHADLREAMVNGENIAAGQRSAAEVHQGWMESPGHRQNRMSDRWTEYGVGVCEDDDGRLFYVERFR
jgi:uncharacterized protein YkwD